MFCTDRVRFVGDICAAVVAESKAQAMDAAEAVVLDIEPLPVVMTPAAGTRAGCAAPVSRARVERLLRDEPMETTYARSTAQTWSLEVTMVSQRLAGVPMETNGRSGDARR